LFLALAAYEEIGFRGYPLARLLPSFGIWPTLLLIAPMFALYHLAMGWPLVQAAAGTGVGSLLFGMAAVAAKRGLAFPVGVHAGWNFTTWCLSSGSGPWKMTFPSYLSHRVQTVGMIVYVTCMLAGTVILWLWTRRTAEPAG
jgi:membrane protease YdiL (CAAX protease family)